MPIPRNELSENIDRVLAGLTALRGVTAAAIVDADGFVTHIRRDFEIDSEALGVAAQVMYGAAQQSAKNVGQGETNIVLAENVDGLILLTSVGNGLLLTLVADRTAMLGSVRFEMKGAVGELKRMF